MLFSYFEIEDDKSWKDQTDSSYKKTIISRNKGGDDSTAQQETETVSGEIREYKRKYKVEARSISKRELRFSP